MVSASILRHVTRGKGGEFPAILENQKSALILEKNALIGSIFGLNFTCKI